MMTAQRRPINRAETARVRRSPAFRQPGRENAATQEESFTSDAVM